MNLKGQEEMVGFVLIIIVVTVILFIFIGIGFDFKNQGSQESTEVKQFLESAMEFTTDCAIGYIPAFANLGELFRECNSGTICVDGRQSCDVLNETISLVIYEGFKIGENELIKGYIFSSKYTSSENDIREILSNSNGSCEGTTVGSDYLIPDLPGRITNSLEICY